MISYVHIKPLAKAAHTSQVWCPNAIAMTELVDDSDLLMVRYLFLEHPESLFYRLGTLNVLY